MIMDILLEQEAKRLSITVSDSEIDQELTKMMKMRRLNRAQFEAQLKKQGMSVDELRRPTCCASASWGPKWAAAWW